MFGREKKTDHFVSLRSLGERATSLSDEIDTIKDRFSEIVSCDTCGCLIYNYTENRGKGEIRQKTILGGISSFASREDYIHYPHYCKIHKPKVVRKPRAKKKVSK